MTRILEKNSRKLRLPGKILLFYGQVFIDVFFENFNNCTVKILFIVQSYFEYDISSIRIRIMTSQLVAQHLKLVLEFYVISIRNDKRIFGESTYTIIENFSGHKAQH